MGLLGKINNMNLMGWNRVKNIGVLEDGTKDLVNNK